MSNLVYRLYDRNGRRVSTANIKSAQRADFIVKNKIIYSMDFPSRYKKSSKEDDIDMFVTVFNEEIEVQKELTKLKAQATKQQQKEIREYKKVLLEREKEIARQQLVEREIEKDLERLYKEDQRLEKIEKKRLKIEDAIETPEDDFTSEREQQLIKEEKKKIRTDKAKLTRSIQGRIRLYIKENLLDKRFFWDEQKEEDFVKILEKLYGKLVRKLEDRNDETNFKKFSKRVIDSLETYDFREVPSSEEIMRRIIKRQKYEEKLQKNNLDYITSPDDYIDFKYSQEKPDYKYYFSKRDNTNYATKRFVYNFDQQLSISPTFNRSKKAKYSEDILDIYETLRSIVELEVKKLYKEKEIVTNKEYQIRFFIPQFDEMGSPVHNYTGGNGKAKRKSGYGISLPSKPFHMNDLDSDINELFELMRDRIANYLSRNIGVIESQYITGFMIIAGV